MTFAHRSAAVLNAFFWAVVSPPRKRTSILKAEAATAAAAPIIRAEGLADAM